MSDWDDFLRGLRPRRDLNDEFPALKFDKEQPVWLSREDVLSAAVVAARVMEVVARRGGSRLGSVGFKAFRMTVSRGLDESARHLCDDEARRVLRWIEDAEPASDVDMDDGSPEIDVMYAADLQSRVSVANFAIQEQYDLEMEYFDEARQTWPRLRCTPLVVREVDDEDITLRFEGRQGEREVALRQVRWLMPVTRRQSTGSQPERDVGEVIRFPAGRESND